MKNMADMKLQWGIFAIFFVIIAGITFYLMYGSKLEKVESRAVSARAFIKLKKNSQKTLREENGLPEHYGIYKLNKKEKIKIFMQTAVILFFAAYIFYQNITLSILFSGLSFFSDKIFQESMKRKRKSDLNEQFKDALYSISSSISAGRQMPYAIKDAIINLELLYSQDAYILKEFEFMMKRFEETHESMEDIFMDFAIRTEVEDIINFTDIYVISRATGGDLEAIIRKTSEMIIEKINVKREIYTIIAQKKYEARILTAMPFVVILFLTLVSPGYLDEMYTTVSGRVIMTIGLFAIGLAYKWSSRITDIEV